MKYDLSGFFKPKSIAVVGASKDSRKIGHAALKNILISDYQCKLYPINPIEYISIYTISNLFINNSII